jgi:hypothetical protein
MRILNLKMMSHPLNWLIIGLMLVIAGAIGHTALSYFGIEPTTKGKKSYYDDMPAGQSPGEPAAQAITPQGSLQA